MKLFVIASLIAISAAARLEHLERSYLPPNQGSFGTNGFGTQGSVGSTSGASGFGAHSVPNSFGANAGSFGANSGSFGATGESNGLNGFGASSGPARRPSYNDVSAFSSATSNQYLPPDQGSASSRGTSQFSGSLQGFGNQRYQTQPQQYSAPQSSSSFGQTQQYSVPSTLYGTPVGSSAPSQNGGSAFGSSSGSGSFGGSRYQSQLSNQYGAASRQYLAPKATSSFQNVPQQSFDEQTGYHY